MEQGVKRTQRDYSLAFKLAVVDQIEKGELTYKQAQERYGIQGRSRSWYGCVSMVDRTGVRGHQSESRGA